MDKGTFDKENVFGQGQPNEAYARYFDGQSFHNPLVDANSPLLLANVTFEHGCLSIRQIKEMVKSWICTVDHGWYQEEGKEVVSSHPK